VSSACSVDGAAYSTYTSVSASLCSKLTSCTSTGTYTYSYTGPTNGPGFPGGTKMWSTDAVTVTGCPWDGGDVGWGPWGGAGGPGGGWGNFGPGWKYTTYTTTFTSTGATATAGANGGVPTASAKFTTIGVATVAQAASGDSTTRTTLGVAAAQTQGAGSAAAPTADVVGVRVMGAALGAVVVAAGLL
jgi:hypothetical protein